MLRRVKWKRLARALVVSPWALAWWILWSRICPTILSVVGRSRRFPANALIKAGARTLAHRDVYVFAAEMGQERPGVLNSD